MSLNISFLDPARGFYAGVSESQLFGVETSFEQGSIHGLKFSSIIDKCSYIEGGISHTDAYSNAVHASRTLVAMSEGGTTVFAGRVFSIGKGLDVTGSVKFCCEDCRGFLRESFIWYSKDPDYEYEEEEEENNSNESSDRYRALAGDDVTDLISELIANHNAFMRLTYGQNYPGGIISGVTGIAQGVTLNNDLSLDGVSTYNAFEQIFADQGLEWDLGFPLQLGIAIRCSPRFTDGGGNISTGINLKSLTRTENADEMFTAILPLGGYGYNGRRLTLTNHDFNEGLSHITIDPDGIDEIVQVWDPSRSEWVDSPDGERENIIAINETLYAHYGLRIKAVTYDDICCDSDEDEEIAYMRQILVEEAKTDAELLNSDIIEWSCDAADLSAIGLGASFKLYGMYNISDRINGITATNCRMIKVTKNYDDPSKSTCSFEMPTSLLE